MRRAESRLKGMNRSSTTLVFIPSDALNFDARLEARVSARLAARGRADVPKRNTTFLDETVGRPGSRARGGQTARMREAIRSRVAASGSLPAAALRLSTMCCGRLVPGIAHVTAGGARIHFRKQRAQLSQSSSAAHAGKACERTRWKRPPSAKGRLARTATPRSR